ncbi:7-carboxy-7-deazaguanine synthase QueE [Solemya pervernicosa gill symbiont]|uniref:7-carboxy-7-deazaguanine synthase n=2 Tax=Gammaproteobacteria incertae sedis TaxID=118884 RepID=A0A1T2L4T8_9GAMM|nr:7-carboxy-7-deazaguanine synthase QueE [Candidatus Reidiella endopervernicosa]OOZ40128.1 7-carboxy-7-deazaguanine synthase QueE [Solemya pervernicosa gill symbiont]QKQ27461.1 7-carboxy-7-deazaguanine synthase QueE [Candidatus Reidiella endopervernicosa]
MSSNERAQQLRISEIFYSLQGESRSVGWPTVFIRLTGCPLRCNYCDTEYAFTGGESIAIESILEQVAQFGAHHVCVTGGEPLAQKGCLKLLTELCDLGYETSLETSGALDISTVDERVVRVVDVKTPDSGESSRNLLENLQYLTARDQLKFVICSREDYEWSRSIIAEHKLSERCEILFSPIHEAQDPTELAEWILEDRLHVRFQLQLHKLLWRETQGR